MDVWRASLAGDASQFTRYLSILCSEEKSRALRFRFDRDRGRYVFARGILRLILGMYLNEDPEVLCFRYNANGKPSLARQFTDPPVDFNLSHAADVALFAFAHGREVGVDTERMDERLDYAQLVEMVLTAQEIAALYALPERKRRPAFFRAWTRKEAYLKALGSGLSCEPNMIEVSCHYEESHRSVAVMGGPESGQQWSLADLPVGDGFVAAVAAEGSGFSTRLWQWQDDLALR